MRDDRFKPVHSGGPLDIHRHRALARWAAACAERVLPRFAAVAPHDDRPHRAIETARAWATGDATVCEARDASLAAQEAALTVTDDAASEAARAAGHAVATAHMAGHSVGVAWCAVRAVVAAEGEAAGEAEREWQIGRLDAGIRDLVLSALSREPCFD